LCGRIHPERSEGSQGLRLLRKERSQ